MSRRPAPLARLVAVALAASTLACAGFGGGADADTRKRQARAHYNIGADYIQKGHLELGLRELLIAERFDPRDAEIQDLLGITYYQKGKVAEGEGHLRRAIELSPDSHEARFNLAVLLLRQERWAECIEQSARLIDDPTFVAPWRALSNRGWCEYKSGKVAEGRRLLELARDYESKDSTTLLNLGILEADQGNRRQAIALFEQVLSLQPGSSLESEVNYRLGEQYAALGERERAVGHLTAALTKMPGGPWGKKSEESLRRLR
jgi:type IV pilus assembly protein PilF